MTLLGWMHRKLRSNNDVFKEFNTGGGGSCNCITGLASPDGEYFVDGTFVANHDLQQTLDTAADLFSLGGSGLLTIGTLGFATVTVPGDRDDEEADYDDVESNDDDVTDVGEAYNDDGAVTPIFTFPALASADDVDKAAMGGTVEAIAEKDDGTTTEDDLMLVSAELEKVLGASGDVPSARVSFATDCPLQGFLFGSPVCSDAESKRDSGGSRRASLGELFLRTRFAEENKVALVTVAEGEDGGEGEKAEGKGGSGGRKRMKKMKVKDEKGAEADESRANPTVTKSKFQKAYVASHVGGVFLQSAFLVEPDEPNRPISSTCFFSSSICAAPSSQLHADLFHLLILLVFSGSSILEAKIPRTQYSLDKLGSPYINIAEQQGMRWGYLTQYRIKILEYGMGHRN